MASGLVDDLLCPVCLDIFCDPHTLDCGHNFCLDCLRDCVAEGKSRGTCPECRCPFKLREIKRHRILANLAEKARKIELDDERPASATSRNICKEHGDPLKLFCRQDRVPICVICRDQPRHRGHEFLPTQDAVKYAQSELEPYLKPLKLRLKETTEEKVQQKEAIGELKSCSEDIINHISTGFAYLHQILNEKEKHIRKSVQKKTKENMEEMQDASLSLKNDISSLTKIIAKVKAALESTDHVAFLKDFQELMDEAKASVEEEQDDNSAAEEEDQKADEEQDENSERNEEHYGGDEKNVVPVLPSLKKFKVALDFKAWGKQLQAIEPREVD